MVFYGVPESESVLFWLFAIIEAKL